MTRFPCSNIIGFHHTTRKTDLKRANYFEDCLVDGKNSADGCYCLRQNFKEAEPAIRPERHHLALTG